VGNQAKYLSYRYAFEQIKRALGAGQYLEVVVIDG